MKNESKIAFIENIKSRTKRAAIETIYLTKKFGKQKELQVITYQIVKSSTSVAAIIGRLAEQFQKKPCIQK